MQKSFLLIVLFLSNCLGGYSQSNAFVFDKVFAFNEGMAAVEKDKKIGFIDDAGKLVIPIIFENGEYDFPQFTNGVAIVRKDRKYGVINKKGQLIVPLKYNKIESFFNGFAQVTNNSYKIGYINSRGQEFIPCMYEKELGITYSMFNNGLVSLQQNKLFGYADTSGKIVIPIKYDYGENFKDGLALVKKYSGTSANLFTITKQGFLNTKGEEIIPLVYDDAFNLGNGFVAVNIGAKMDENVYFLTGGKWGVIDSKGKTILPLEYNYIIEANKGLIIAEKGEDENKIMYVFDYTGKPIFNQPGRYLKNLHNDRLFLSKKQGKEFAIYDKKGKQISDYVHRLLYSNTFIQTDLFVVGQPARLDKYKYKYGYIDINGKNVIPITYDEAYNFYNGEAVVKINDKYGVINEKNNIVIPFEYNFLGEFKNGFYQAKNSEGKSGFINKQGKPLPIQFPQNVANIELDVVQGGEAGKVDSSFTSGIRVDDFIIANYGASLGSDGFYRGGKWGVVNSKYKTIVEAKYDAIKHDPKEKIFLLYQGKKCSFTKNWNTNTKRYDLGFFYDSVGKFLVGYANYDGKILSPPSFDQVLANNQNKCFIVRDAKTLKYGILNSNYTLLIKPQYEKIRFFLNDSLFLVEEKKLFGIVNLKNQLLQPFIFLKVGNADKALYPNCIELSNKTQKIIINKSGAIIKEEKIQDNGNTSSVNNLNANYANFEKDFSMAKTTDTRVKLTVDFMEKAHQALDSVDFFNLWKEKVAQINKVDFYAGYEVLMKLNINLSEIKLLMTTYTTSQRAMINKYASRISENFQRKYSQNLPPLPEPPTECLQPGQPWKE